MNTDALIVPAADLDLAAVRTVIFALLREPTTAPDSLLVVARLSGVPVQVIEERWSSWDDLLLDSVEDWRQERLRALQAATETGTAVQFVRRLVEEYARDRTVARNLLAFYRIAGQADHPLAEGLREGRARFRALIQRALDEDVRTGRERIVRAREGAALQLAAIYEGLQLLALREAPDAVLAEFDRSVTALRRVWDPSLARAR